MLLQECSRIAVNRFIASDGGPKSPPSGRPDAFTVIGEVRAAEWPKRILVVEDHLDSVHTLAFLLRDMGHTVEYAINGYVAVELALRFRPDFVLLDLGLPGIDGFEVCRQMKRAPELRSTRIVALTAFSQDEYRERATKAGCELYLVKPVPTPVLEHLFK